MDDSRYDWARLTPLQVGKYAEYLTKMEFLLHGCDVYSSEVDQLGIDFVVRTRSGHHFDVQVKSYRLGRNNYVFVPKSKFPMNVAMLLALVEFQRGKPPSMYLVPACVKGEPNPILESRDYGPDLKSPPEWGLSITKRKRELLEAHYRFERITAELLIPAP